MSWSDGEPLPPELHEAKAAGATPSGARPGAGSAQTEASAPPGAADGRGRAEGESGGMGGCGRDRSPGEVAPRRLLERPPGERFGAGNAAPESRLEPASSGRAVALGTLAWVAVILGWLVLAGALGLDWGMIVVAAVGGWMVGTLVRSGAWSGGAHHPSLSLRLFAAVLAASTWLGGQFLVYLWTRVTLPASGLDLGGRIAATPFGDYLGGVIGPLDALEIVLLAAIAWLSAR